MPRTSSRCVLLAVWALSQCLPRAANADWPQWGGSPGRNNVSDVRNLPADWHPGEFDRKTGRWIKDKARNVKWVAPLGSQSYGSPVIADGRIFVGTNNQYGYLTRFPADHDLGCLLCFREQDGQFLWQFSAEKLATGRVHDWPLMGIVSSPLVEGDRAWFVSNRGEVLCVDTRGFYDDEDDGPVVGEEVLVVSVFPHDEVTRAAIRSFPSAEPAKDPILSLVADLDRAMLPADLRARLLTAGVELPAQIAVHVKEAGADWSFSAEVNQSVRRFAVRRGEKSLQVFLKQTAADKREADVVWRFDMMQRLGSRQHNLATCCITSWKDTLFVCTSNGVDESHLHIPAPQAPSFFAMNKHTAEVLWTSNLPGANIHHGQWSAPAVGVMGGVPQVVFCGGDGWVYSFHAEEWQNQRPKLLWKFDTNPKDSVLQLGGRGTRNDPIAIPVLHDNKVFVTTGQDPEHGEGEGCIWCIDATKKLDGSDVSPHKVVDRQGNVVPPRRTKQVLDWSEERLWLGDSLYHELDRGEVNSYFLRRLSGKEKPPAGFDVRVKTMTTGAQWEMSVRSGDEREIMQVWRRPHVNDLGELETIHLLARRTGERIVPNPDSAVVWKYDGHDRDGDGKREFYEQMHRSISSVVIVGDLLFCPDFSGLFHCLDARTGKPHWNCDLLAACWGTPLVADGRVFVGDEDGDVAIFRLSADPALAGARLVKDPAAKNGFEQWHEPAVEINMLNSLYTNSVAANGVLYITNKDHVFAIALPAVKQP